jgi:hypothetical protein
VATLNARQKRFIIKRLAVFVPPSEVQSEFQAEFGVEVSSGQVAYYDPTNERGKDLAARWTELFHETRTRFLEDFTASTFQYKAVRLRELEGNYRKLQSLMDELETMNHFLGAADLIEQMNEVMEQVAKEMGHAFTNRKELEHSGDVSLHESEDFQQTIQVLMDALEDHPEARTAVASALTELDADE